MAMGGTIITQAKAKEAYITAVVTRADGTKEDLGVISYWHRNPLRRWAFAIRQLLRGKTPW